MFMLLQVSSPGSIGLFSLSFTLWLIVIITVTVAAVIYFLKHYNKPLLWAHQVIDPLQHGLHKWNRQLNNWWQHNRSMHFFQRNNNFYAEKEYAQRGVITGDSFAEELIDNVFSDTDKKKEDAETGKLKEENQLLQQQNTQLKQELHFAKTHNQQLLHEIEELLQFRQLNQQLQERINTLQSELNDVTGKWMKESQFAGRLNDEVNSLSGIEKDWIDAVNHAKELEWQVQKISILENEIKSLEAEREWLLVQLQQIKTKQLHEYETLQESYARLVEEKNLLQHKIVLLESGAGALSRALNNNKLQLNEDALCESKYITAARELNTMRLQYGQMESELSMLRNKEQLLVQKAKLADGLQTTLLIRNEEITALQRQLYDCRRK